MTRTNALETLVIASFVRGLSVRDVEATLADALGEQGSVSRSTVSRICEQIKVQFEDWSRRQMDEVTLDYLFLDGSHFKYHANAAVEPVLAAWGSTPTASRSSASTRPPASPGTPGPGSSPTSASGAWPARCS